MTTTAGRALLDAMGRQPCDCVAHRHPAETIAAIEREAYEQATLDAARVPSDGLREWVATKREVASEATLTYGEHATGFYDALGIVLAEIDRRAALLTP
jgi:hypothetical protein